MMDKSIWQRHIVPLKPISTALQPTGQTGNHVQAVIFDIYGTLFISASGDISLAQKHALHLDKQLSRLLHEHGLTHSPSVLKRSLFKAIEQKHGELNACGIEHPEVQIDHIWGQVLNCRDMVRIRKFALEYELIVNPVYPMPGLDKVLAEGRRAQLPMGVISNAQFFTPYLFAYFLEADEETLGFSPELTIYSYKTGHAKPSPYLFELATERLQTLGLKPENTLYVGNDMLNDMYPAKRAGFKTVLFAGDQRSLRLRTEDPRCANFQPDVIITDLTQLLDYIL